MQNSSPFRFPVIIGVLTILLRAGSVSHSAITNRKQFEGLLDAGVKPFVRSGGTALIPVKRASDCVAMKLSPEDVIPADKLGTCKSQALPVCNPDVNHEYKCTCRLFVWCLRAHKKVSKDEPATIRGTEDAPSSATGNSFNNAPLTIDGTKGSSEREIVTKEKTVIRNTHSEENEEKDSKSKDEINETTSGGTSMNLEVDLASGSNSASGNRNISRPPDNIALTDQQGSSMEKSSSEANEKIESLSSERVLRGDPQENNSAPRAATEDQSDDSSVSNGRVGEAVKSERPESVQQRSEREVTSEGHCNSLNSSKLCSGLQESCPEASGGQCVLISSCPTADDCNCTTKFRCSGAKESPNSSGNLFEPERLRTVEVDSIEDCNAGECPEFKDECPSSSGKCRLDHQCDNGAPATAGGEGEEVKCKCLVHFACALKNAPEKVMDDIEAESFRRKRST